MKRSILAVSILVASSSACAPATADEDFTARIQAANDELLNQGNAGAATEFFAPVYVVHAGDQDITGGPEIIQGFVTQLRTAFPDLHVEVEVLVADGDKVAWIRRHRGTHQGDFMGVPASGRVIEWQDMVVTRYEGDKIAEEWVYQNLASACVHNSAG